jgi:dTDP-4-dehydrorhamnose 3,5-epimerase
LIEPQVFGDERGYFMGSCREVDFKQSVADVRFVQDNQSKSRQGIVRRLFYQLKHPRESWSNAFPAVFLMSWWISG